MAKIKGIDSNVAVLQSNDWPPVPEYYYTVSKFDEFLELPLNEQQDYLASLRSSDDYAKILHQHLGTISAYLFSYHDSPRYLATDDNYEINLQRAKILLEREVLDHWLCVKEIPQNLSQEQAGDFLMQLSYENKGLLHPLFDYLEKYASREAFKYFLWNEVARNEVVDDEVAVMVTGIQGAMKAAVCSNLWDEVGHCKLENFHTYWLRRLVDATGGTESLLSYRRNEKPWYTMITTNVFNIMLTRPGLKFRRYGWFLMNESWVAPHFEKLIRGMERVGLNDNDITIYFTAHVAIDPRHTEELVSSMQIQKPRLKQIQVDEILKGALMSLAASCAQYDYMLDYLKEETERSQLR